jgi:hypothetical protein
MSETTRMWIESSFNVFYMIFLWTLVILMFLRFTSVSEANRATVKWALAAFLLLALGDTGHVGFRVFTFATGNLARTVSLFDSPVSLIGIGVFTTSFTLTLFYAMLVFVWRERFQKRIGWFEWLLFAAGIVRLVMLFLPQNEWAGTESPYPWNVYRNIPLLVQGLGVAWLTLRDAVKTRDRTFTWMGAMILVSYSCYTPVLFLAHTMPLISMLMLPKTLAYLAVVFIAYLGLYPRKKSAPAV